MLGDLVRSEGVAVKRLSSSSDGAAAPLEGVVFPLPEGVLLLLLLDNIELQMIAKRALSGKRGAVVAMDPRTGGVLAMYSNPSYDGNLFVHGISSKNYKKLLNSKNLPLINRSVQGYPPASTVKPFLSVLLFIFFCR